MFVKAFEEAIQFTRPIHTIVRYWEGEQPEPGTSSLFFVNDEGWALTCKHVANVLGSSGKINETYEQFKIARDSSKGSRSRSGIVELGRKFGYKRGTVIEIYNRVINCVEGKLTIDLKLHPSVDLALLKFKNYDKLLCNKFPRFAKDSGILKPGKFICRLGFPFPEFTNFEHDEAGDKMQWTTAGKEDTPCFPIEGMLTRHLGKQGDIVGFELSTPGLKGQSGGPAFDSDGLIIGMQCATNHLDLQFDLNKDVFRSGRKVHVLERTFLHVGHCVHLDVMKAFMNEHGVKFSEG